MLVGGYDYEESEEPTKRVEVELPTIPTPGLALHKHRHVPTTPRLSGGRRPCYITPSTNAADERHRPQAIDDEPGSPLPSMSNIPLIS